MVTGRRIGMTGAAVLLAALTLLPVHGGAGAQDSPPDGLLVPAARVLRSLSSRRPPMLVDIRPQRAFQRCRIPGSINVPLAFVRVKAFLKKTPLVLISRGYGQRFMEAPCRRLRAAGFDAAILLGGLCAWRQAGGPLAGDLTALDLPASITARRFFQERDASYWLVVNTTATPGGDLPAPFAAAVRVVSADRAAGLPRDLARAVADRADDPLLTVLVLGSAGTVDARAHRALALLRGVPVVFLEGGLQGYRRFLTQRRLAIRAGRRPRADRAADCSPCRKGRASGATR